MLNHEHTSQVKSMMFGKGLNCPAHFITNGKIQRFSQSGDQGKPCWYVLHILSNNLVYVIFGCWKRGIYGVWCNRNIKDLSSYDKGLIKQKQKELERELQEKNAQAKRNIQHIWEHADPNFNEHAYLTNKRVKSFGLRLHKGRLLVPLYNEDNELCSLQNIAADGTKWFEKDTHTKGCFFIIGKLGEKIYITEGYATAATIHEVMGETAAIAFNANNLLPVAQIIRKKNPYKNLVICADNDAFGGA